MQAFSPRIERKLFPAISPTRRSTRHYAVDDHASTLVQQGGWPLLSFPIPML